MCSSKYKTIPFSHMLLLFIAEFISCILIIVLVDK